MVPESRGAPSASSRGVSTAKAVVEPSPGDAVNRGAFGSPQKPADLQDDAHTSSSPGRPGLAIQLREPYSALSGQSCLSEGVIVSSSVTKL